VVDDKIPAKSEWKRDANNKLVKIWKPVYASSAVRGEIWPMIAEKVWAKISGTYNAIGNGGTIASVFARLSDDPFRAIPIRNGN